MAQSPLSTEILIQQKGMQTNLQLQPIDKDRLLGLSTELRLHILSLALNSALFHDPLFPRPMNDLISDCSDVNEAVQALISAFERAPDRSFFRNIRTGILIRCLKAEELARDYIDAYDDTQSVRELFVVIKQLRKMLLTKLERDYNRYRDFNCWFRAFITWHPQRSRRHCRRDLLFVAVGILCSFTLDYLCCRIACN